MRRIIILLLLAFALVSCSPNIDTAINPSDDSYAYDGQSACFYETPCSDCFSSVGYNYRKKELTVVFRDGPGWYVYYDVPEDVFEEFYDSDSLGTYYNENIKGNYEYENLTEKFWNSLPERKKQG